MTFHLRLFVHFFSSLFHLQDSGMFFFIHLLSLSHIVRRVVERTKQSIRPAFLVQCSGLNFCDLDFILIIQRGRERYRETTTHSLCISRLERFSFVLAAKFNTDCSLNFSENLLVRNCFSSFILINHLNLFTDLSS